MVDPLREAFIIITRLPRHLAEHSDTQGETRAPVFVTIVCGLDHRDLAHTSSPLAAHTSEASD